VSLGRESAPTLPEAPRIEHFVGRGAELAALRAAYEALLEEQLVCVYVHGPSGAGKSALLHRFLMGLRHQEGAVVLRGRCAQGDATPFNGFASLSAAIALYLRRLSPGDARALLPRPRDVAALARLFPELGRVPAVAEAAARASSGAVADAAEEAAAAQGIRQRGFTALRQLLWKLAERRPLVVGLEDLQWIDGDSVALLLELVRPPDPPAMLFVGSYRSEEAAASAPLASLLEQHLAAAAEGGRARGIREVKVGPLPPVEAVELALSLLYAWDEATRARAAEIARASGGNPRVLGELARAVQQAEDAAPEPGGATGALRARLARLPEQARRLLEVMAVAGAPVSLAAAARAAGLEPGEQAPALALLRTEDLARVRARDARGAVEIGHDDLRAVIVARLDPARLRACHEALARALEPEGDPELVAARWLDAGDAARAGRFLVTAAEQAAGALAFERAARLYQWARALALAPGDDAALAARCGDALVNAGEGAAAAAVYAEAAARAEPAAALDLRRRAAEQHLCSGHIDEGLALVREVLSAVGLALPATPRRARLSLLVLRAKLRLRGLRFRERAPAEISAEDLARIDACWMVTVGLTAVDLSCAAVFSARGLLLALDAGEPRRILRALAFEAASACMAGERSRGRAEALVAALRGLAARLDGPHAEGLTLLACGMLESFARGRWRDAAPWFERAEDIFRDRCAGAVWELSTTQLLASWARFYLGHIGALGRALPAVVRAAEQRGDRYTLAVLGVASAWAALAADDIPGARRAVAAAMSGWSQAGFHLEHLIELLAHGYLERYAGKPAAALQRFQERWGELEASMLLRLQNHRITTRIERASTALAAAEGAADPAPLLAIALRDAAALERERAASGWPAPFAALIRAGAAAVRGEREAALALLDRAIAGFDADGMQLYAAAARRQAGELCAREKRLELQREADAAMARENIENPARWAAMLAPGFGRSADGMSRG